LVASGSLAHLIKTSLGASYRTEHFRGEDSNLGVGTADSLKRQVASAYIEAVLPLIGAENAHPAVRRLQFSAAIRYDHYTSFGAATNPKGGVVWEPIAGLKVRSTAGTSFQAPLLSQLGAPVTSNTALVPYSGAPTGLLDVLEINGGNSALRPEKSTSLTTGLDIQPAELPGLSLSMTYFYSRLKNQIEAQDITSEALFAQPRLLPFLAFASESEVEPYFSSPGFQGDYAGFGPAGVKGIFDNQFANIASTIQSSVDFSLKYQLPTAYGRWNGWLSGTHLLTDRLQTASFEPWIDIDNTVAEPTKWKARGGGGWAYQGFALNVFINYVNAYRNTLLSPATTIGSWTTADLSLAYQGSSGALAGFSVLLAVQNVADRRPPYVQIPAADLLPGQPFIPFDGSNASAVGRLISLRVTKQW
jgi:iron complex outermembrane receptor protein